MTDLRALLGECHATVTRGGIEDACGKPAAGWAKPSGDETHPWPACAYHLNRWGGMPLTAVLPREVLRQKAAAWDEGYRLGKADAALNAVRVDGQYVQSINPH